MYGEAFHICYSVVPKETYLTYANTWKGFAVAAFHLVKGAELCKSAADFAAMFKHATMKNNLLNPYKLKCINTQQVFPSTKHSATTSLVCPSKPFNTTFRSGTATASELEKGALLDGAFLNNQCSFARHASISRCVNTAFLNAWKARLKRYKIFLGEILHFPTLAFTNGTHCKQPSADCSCWCLQFCHRLKLFWRAVRRLLKAVFMESIMHCTCCNLHMTRRQKQFWRANQRLIEVAFGNQGCPSQYNNAVYAPSNNSSHRIPDGVSHLQDMAYTLYARANLVW